MNKATHKRTIENLRYWKAKATELQQQLDEERELVEYYKKELLVYSKTFEVNPVLLDWTVFGLCNKDSLKLCK